MFIKLTVQNSKKAVLVAMDNIAMIQPAEGGSLIATKHGSSVAVNQPVHMIEALLKGAKLCIVA